MKKESADNVMRRRLNWLALSVTAVLLPVAGAITSSVASSHQGPVRVYWALGAILSTLLVALSGFIKDARGRKARLAGARAQDALRMTLAEASQPLITMIGNVSAVTTPSERKEALTALVALALGTVRAQCGCGTRASYRSVFYSLVNERHGRQNRERLVRVKSEGRNGDGGARLTFDPGCLTDDEDKREEARKAVKLAKGEDVLLVEDLQSDAPSYIRNAANRSYRTMLSIPVNAGDRHFGLLTLDSPEAGTLKEIDKRYMILIAGVLGAGLAQLAREGIAIVQNGGFAGEGAK